MAATKPRVEYDYPVGHGDIMRPVVLHFNGMSFRKCTTSYRGFRPTPQQHVPYQEEEEEETVSCVQQPSCMDKVDDLLDIKELPDGTYQIQMTIPSVFFKYIIGRQGKVKQMIERDTKSSITIPRMGNNGPITIQAKAKRSLNSAKQRIEVIAWSNRQREDPTHFIGIALHSDSVQAKVEEFNCEVLRTCTNSKEGVDENILQVPIRMHLTISVLRLFSSEEIREAIKSLTKIVDKCRSVFKSFPPVIELKGIDCMNDDYSSVDVVYAKVNGLSSGLQEFADGLLSEMNAEMSDFVKDDGCRNVKLHATVMNSNWRVAKDDKGRKLWKQRESFDATKIFRNFKDFNFGSCELKQVMLLDMNARDDKGFYKCLETFSV